MVQGWAHDTITENYIEETKFGSNFEEFEQLVQGLNPRIQLTKKLEKEENKLIINQWINVYDLIQSFIES